MMTTKQLDSRSGTHRWKGWWTVGTVGNSCSREGGRTRGDSGMEEVRGTIGLERHSSHTFRPRRRKNGLKSSEFSDFSLPRPNSHYLTRLEEQYFIETSWRTLLNKISCNFPSGSIFHPLPHPFSLFSPKGSAY